MQYNMENITGGNEGSALLRSFTSLKDIPQAYALLACHNFKWSLNNGEKVYFWEDDWHRGGPLMSQFLRLYRISKLQYATMRTVWNMWTSQNDTTGLWTRPLLDRDASLICSLNQLICSINLENSEGDLCWILGNGQFSTKMFHSLIGHTGITNQNIEAVWGKLWSFKVP